MWEWGRASGSPHWTCGFFYYFSGIEIIATTGSRIITQPADLFFCVTQGGEGGRGGEWVGVSGWSRSRFAILVKKSLDMFPVLLDCCLLSLFLNVRVL